eukprot:TRINITY_DN9201_c0_g1_i1.p1 TRINITY_DN9201_c0_g1~~TRINITY_DN9201_c0_g1_i1.p1  ORF type:complete len:718 (-),score=133.09 TRINITY_DN9201_c0_g1_i1:31-2145(-)
MKDHIRIVLVGEDKTGKSSIIYAHIFDSWQERVGPVIPEFVLSPALTSAQVTVHLVDTAARTPDKVDQELKKADVLCIIYDLSRPESFFRVRDYWLPHISQLGSKVPIILAGNKADIKLVGFLDELNKEIPKLLETYKQIEETIHVSAKKLDVHGLFDFAIAAVLHPIEPLYDRNTCDLKEDYSQALRRIFWLCDRDGDGTLNDNEFTKFDNRCFGETTQGSKLLQVKKLIYEHLAENPTIGGSPGDVNDDGINFLGFLVLHKFFIRNRRTDTCWVILREFGYGDDLKLRRDYICPIKMEIKPHVHCVELSEAGTRFLYQVFSICDKNRDGLLSTEDLEPLQAIVPDPCLFMQNINFLPSSSSINVKQFLLLWSLAAFQNYAHVLNDLAYLGYGDGVTARKFVSPFRIFDRIKDRKNRSLFQIHLQGSSAEGKKLLMNNNEASPQKEIVAKYHVVDGQEKILVMNQAVGPKYQADSVVDLACIIFDANDREKESQSLISDTQCSINEISCAPPCFYLSIPTKPDELTDSPTNDCRELEKKVGQFCCSMGVSGPYKYKQATASSADTTPPTSTSPPLSALPHALLSLSPSFSTGGARGGSYELSLEEVYSTMLRIAMDPKGHVVTKPMKLDKDGSPHPSPSSSSSNLPTTQSSTYSPPRSRNRNTHNLLVFVGIGVLGVAIIAGCVYASRKWDISFQQQPASVVK